MAVADVGGPPRAGRRTVARVMSREAGAGGPPGAGKGTQAEFIAAHLAVPKISTGDIFRANVAQGTPLGRRGQAVHGRRPAGPGRGHHQHGARPAGRARRRRRLPARRLPAHRRRRPSALDKLLADLGVGLDLVLELVVDDDEVIRRLSGRRTCRGCGKIWHVEFDAPQHEGVCDRCGGELFQRDDDKAETIAERLRVYAARHRAAGRLLRRPGQAGGHRRHRPGRGRHRARDRRAALVRRLSVRLRAHVQPAARDPATRRPSRSQMMRAAGLVVGRRAGRDARRGRARRLHRRSWTRSPRR